MPTYLMSTLLSSVVMRSVITVKVSLQQVVCCFNTQTCNVARSMTVAWSMLSCGSHLSLPENPNMCFVWQPPACDAISSLWRCLTRCSRLYTSPVCAVSETTKPALNLILHIRAESSKRMGDLVKECVKLCFEVS